MHQEDRRAVGVVEQLPQQPLKGPPHVVEEGRPGGVVPVVHGEVEDDYVRVTGHVHVVAGGEVGGGGAGHCPIAAIHKPR